MKKDNLPKIVPLFPLSNFIIFPHTTVPFNIFEPRYVEMINDSMKNDKMIGLIQPQEGGSDSMPKLHKIGCLGKIIKLLNGNTGIIFGKSSFFILSFSKFLKIYILMKNFIIACI